MPVTTLPLAPNVPIAITIKYVDVWPNDPSKNNGKGYGPSLALRGDVDGEDVRVYPKGFLDANLYTLSKSGVIAPDAYDDDPSEKYSIKVLQGDVRIMMAQPAGERYGKFHVESPAKVPNPVPGKTAPIKSPVNMGGPLPNEAGYMDMLVGDTTPPPIAGGSSKILRAVDDYTAALTHIIDQVIPVWIAGKIAFDASAVNAAVATILIRSEKL